MTKLYCTLCIETAKINNTTGTVWSGVEAEVVYNGSSLCLKHFLLAAPKKGES